MSVPLLSSDAEQSRRLIFETLFGHRATIAAIRVRSVRRGRFPGAPTGDQEQIQRQATLVRFMSITDAFVTQRLYSELEAIKSTRKNPATQKVWNDLHDRATGSWKAQQQAYHSWLDVPEDLWKQIMDLADARNAVAHGYGELTLRQKRGKRETLENRLKPHQITLHGDRIILTESAIALAASTCRTFIKNIDGALTS